MRILISIIISVIAALSLPYTANAQINAEQVMRIGQNSLYFEDYMLSIQYFNQVIHAKPYLARPYFLRAIAKLNLEDYQGAEEDASKAIEINPFITDAYEVRGVARQNLGLGTEAISDYRHALELLPQNRQLMFNMAMAQETTGDLEGAADTYARLLKAYPGFDNGYIGRARLYLAQGDTTAAAADIDKALEINKNATNAYVMRADLAIKRHADYAKALSDMDEAIKLQPRFAAFYINRAFLRYNLDDYFGAMADYDYSLQLEPLNTTALFNRGLLLTEVNAFDRALIDFSKVLELDPDDYRALYNRALIYGNKMQYPEAIADINQVISAFPDFPGAIFMRSEFYSKMGDRNNAMRDYDSALAMSRKKRPAEDTTKTGNGKQPDNTDEKTPDDISRRFASLLTIENSPEIQEEFNNKDIRGKVQDRNFTIEIEPMMELSYHASPTELRENTYYIKEVDELNATRALRQTVMVTNHPPVLTDPADINQHFSSIEYYNAYIATHPPRAVDHIGRALDLVTIHNYAAAIKDLDKAAELAPDYAPIYFLRAQARYRELKARENGSVQTSDDPAIALHMRRKTYGDIIDDISHVITLSPRMPEAHFNRGNIYTELQDLTSALNAYNEAIRLKPDMGEAYFNRGYVYLKLGNRDAAVNDLSKAGELGILPAYSLLKRISR
ncbi:MAG TPA: tetratricopeptide repeat protein [Muribaculaceae bacterium]|nr:tetratricopeptide repeat protein [Muribaculaceae bacterium]